MIKLIEKIKKDRRNAAKFKEMFNIVETVKKCNNNININVCKYIYRETAGLRSTQIISLHTDNTIDINFGLILDINPNIDCIKLFHTIEEFIKEYREFFQYNDINKREYVQIKFAQAVKNLN